MTALLPCVRRVAAAALPTALLAFTLGAHAQAPAGSVEVMLAAPLDEARGYCLDIAGGQGANAPLDKGLQAHTCYHYTGKILEDQGFDAAQIGQGQFRITHFNVCMTADAVKTGAAIGLAPCAGLPTQGFTHNSAGQLVSRADAQLCVTVSSTDKREGRGGSPVHVMRPLSLQRCAEALTSQQTWTLRAL